MIVFILTIISLGVFSWAKAYSLAYSISHPKRCTFEPLFKGALSSRKFEFTTEDRVTLTGIEALPEGEVKGTVIVCHYLGGSKEMAVSFSDFLLLNGFRLLSFDFRNHGESRQHKSIVFGFDKDFKAFFTEVKKMFPDEYYGVLGFSIGSNVALLGMDLYKEIRAVIIDSGPLLYSKNYFCYVLDDKKIRNPLCRIMFLWMYLNYAGFNKLAEKTRNILKRAKGKPVMIIQGDKDHIIPADNAKSAFEAVRSGAAELWLIPNSRHLTNRVVAKNEYQKRILEFFSSNIISQGKGVSAQ